MTKNEIRDIRKRGWYWIDAILVKEHGYVLGVNAIAVYNVLAAYANNETAQAFPSIRTICKHINLSEVPVRNALTRLEQAGWITVERRKTDDGSSNISNLYTLLPTPDPTLLNNLPPLKKRGRLAKGAELNSRDNKTNSGVAKHGPMFEAILFAFYGVVYKPKMKVPADQRGPANTYAPFFEEELEATPQDVLGFYADWRRNNPPHIKIPLTKDAIRRNFPMWRASRTNGQSAPAGPAVPIIEVEELTSAERAARLAHAKKARGQS